MALSAAPLLHVGPDGRHLVDSHDQPFYLVGDTAWSLALSLTESDAGDYLRQRAAQGFNAVLMDSVGLTSIVSGSSTDANGDAPFNGFLPGTTIYDVSMTPAAGDVSSSAGKYWQHIDNLIDMASANGIEVVFDVYDTYSPWFRTSGADGDSPNSTAQLQAYGQFLGQRYGDNDNIIWMFGNDYLANPAGNADIAAVIEGIRQFDSTHLMTMEMDSNAGFPPAAFDNSALRQYLTLNGIYLYNTGPYRPTYLEQYDRTDFGPTFNIETGYENNSGIGVTAAAVRAGHYSFLLNAAIGDLYGNERVGGAFAGGPFASDWKTQMSSQGAREMTYFGNLVNSVAWYTLVPDQDGTVFQGVGTPTDYSGARSTDGTLAIAYQPASGTGGQSFTVHMNQFAGPVTAQWYDPTGGTYITIGSGLANSGNQTFTSPTANSAGQNDFVLVLKAAPATPTRVTVNVVDSALNDSDKSSLVTFEFSQDVTGFDADDLSAVGGTLSAFAALDGRSYTALFTANDGVAMTGSVAVGTGYTDLAGNAGEAGSDTVSIDTLNPTVTVNIVAASLNESTNSSLVTFAFSEDVAGFDADDLSATGGTLSAFAALDGHSYTALLTADGGVETTGSVALGAGYTDLAGNAGAAGGDTVAIDVVGPRVTQVLVASSQWSPGFYTSLVTSALGTSDGLTIPTDSDQTKPVWLDAISRIVLKFSEDVDVQQGDLVVTGVSVPSYSSSAFRYTAATRTAVWTLSASIGNDTLTLHLDGSSPAAVRDPSGNKLDGQGANDSTAPPSGEGAIDGDMSSRINVLLGDVNQDNIVDISDIQKIAAHYLEAFPAADVNGDNQVEFFDVQAVGANYLHTGGQAGGPIGRDAAAASLLLPRQAAETVDGGVASDPGGSPALPTDRATSQSLLPLIGGSPVTDAESSDGPINVAAVSSLTRGARETATDAAFLAGFDAEPDRRLNLIDGLRE